MDNVDAVGVRLDQFDDIGATARDMARVEAKTHGRVIEHALNLVRVLHHGAPVRVQTGSHTALLANLTNAGQVVEERLPTLLVQDGAGVVAFPARVGGQDEELSPGSLERVELLVDHGDRVEVRVVHDREEEGANRLEPVLADDLRALGGVDGQPALGAELGGGQTDLLHLGEHALGAHLVAPVRDLTYAPTDGGSCNLHCFLP